MKRIYDFLRMEIKKAWYHWKFGENIKINVGSGLGVQIDGWLSLDYIKAKWKDFGKSEVDINENIAYGIPLRNEVVEALYVSHFLEHLTWFEGEIFLSECFRILCQSGVMRIIVPNGDYFIKRFYEKNYKFFKSQEECYNHWLGNITDTFLWNILGAFYSRKRNFSRHAMFYNEENLIYRLQKVGFKKIKRKEFNQTDYPQFRNEYKFFPNYDIPRVMGENSLIVEVFKEGDERVKQS